jgi:hypothetical protein
MRRVLLVGLLGLSSLLNAQEYDIVSDRPGFNTGTYTVKTGQYNIELGYQYAFNNSGADHSVQTAPQFNFRTGINSKVEFNLLWDGWNIADATDQSITTSTSDLVLGGKFRVVENEQYNVSILGLLSLPVGSEPSTTDHIDPIVGVLWDYSKFTDITFFGMFIAKSTKVDDSRDNHFQPTIGASYSFPNTPWGVFIEYHSDISLNSVSDNQHVVDGGFTYLLRKSVQLDFSVGIGLNDSTDNFIATGIAFTF